MVENTIRMKYMVPTYVGYRSVFRRGFTNKKAAVQYARRKWFEDLRFDEEDASIEMIDIKTGEILRRWIFDGKEIISR